MKIDIRKYWTSAIRGDDKFDAIATSENPEFNELGDCLKRLLNDTFVQDSTEYGVGRWENMLNIIPTADQTLEDRKVKILTYLNVKLPYTWKMLEATLNSVIGSDNYTMSLNNQIYTLTLNAKFQSTNQKRDVVELLNNVVPKNLMIEVVEL